ncbi:MAG: DEAD/DEAH box helicase, partial [Acidimicrobiales bacterium]
EALTDGVFDGLDAAGLAAVVSGCTYEVRQGRRPPRRHVPAPLRGAFDRLEALCEDLRDEEDEARIAHTRRVERAFAEPVFRWARGERLEPVLDRAEMAPGDFVRATKQLVDLLRQLAMVAPLPATARTAGQAVDALVRGVVAASVGPAGTV